MSSAGAAPRAAAPASNARAEASRKNGVKSRGPKTPEGKARAAQNALKHGMRAQKHVLLPQEDAAAFAALEAAILAELAPQGALQTVLARRVAVAAWRLERADRLEVEVLEVRSYDGANPGVALIRDGNGTRAFDTLMRYRNAAMAEFWRALRTLKALQAEQEAADAPAPRPTGRRLPNEPERLLHFTLPQPATAGCALHETGAPALRCAPNEPHSHLPPSSRPVGEVDQQAARARPQAHDARRLTRPLRDLAAPVAPAPNEPEIAHAAGRESPAGPASPLR